ncbi:MAG: flagellar hook assembly protein FlgD [Bacteriovoracaceae bacterium]
MSDIGRPAPSGPNPYRNIKKADVSKFNNAAKRNVGNELNDIAGFREESQFVDPKKHNQMDKDAFMKLLTFQLANQDPLSPMDQKQFSGELAQFAQLEQMAKMNKNIEGMSDNIPTQDKFYGASFIGKTVKTSGSSINYDSKRGSAQLPFFLHKDAKNVIIRVYDDRNQMVSQFERENMSRGAQSIYWNGAQRDGTRAGDGAYRFEVIGFDEQSEAFKGQTWAQGLVTGVTFENGETVLTVDDNKKVFLRDVMSFGLNKEGAAAKPQAMAPKPSMQAKAQAMAAPALAQLDSSPNLPSYDEEVEVQQPQQAVNQAQGLKQYQHNFRME